MDWCAVNRFLILALGIPKGGVSVFQMICLILAVRIPRGGVACLSEFSLFLRQESLGVGQQCLHDFFFCSKTPSGRGRIV